MAPMERQTHTTLCLVPFWPHTQSVVRKLKARTCEYDYVEVMACPSGCLNGGGQIKPSPDETAAQLLARVEEAYAGEGQTCGGGGGGGGACGRERCNGAAVVCAHEEHGSGAAAACARKQGCAPPIVRVVYEHVLHGAQPGSAAAAALLHTRYRKREKSVGLVAASDW
eukprot:354108-Chlamydomonas_euryale.AAC.2